MAGSIISDRAESRSLSLTARFTRLHASPRSMTIHERPIDILRGEKETGGNNCAARRGEPI